MSVIQKIRDKYAVVIIVLICLAIVSFLLQDVFFGNNSMFSQSNTVGKVNGVELDRSEYMQRIDVAQERARQQMGGNALSEEAQQGIREQAWDEFLREQIMKAQYAELGIEVTPAELVDAYTGKNPHPLVMQNFVNPQTGVFDRSMLDQVRENARQDNTGQTSAQLQQFDAMLTEYQKSTKYVTLINQGIYYPKWLSVAQQEENSKNANIGYVHVPYATIPDSTVKVTDSELNKYIQDNKAIFEVPESRKLEYVSFDVIPTGADTLAALTELNKLKAELDTTPDPASFTKLNSDLGFFDGYVSRSAIQVPNKDSIVDLPVGTIYGPYQDNSLIVFAKILDRKNMADSVKLNQVVILARSANDSSAKKRADSVEAVIRGGGDIAAIAAAVSDDQQGKTNGGEVTLTPASTVDPLLNGVKDFAFSGTTGQTKTFTLEGGRGYIIAKIAEQKNIGPAVKIAYLGKRVESSNTTSSEALAAANDFASKANNSKSFEKVIQEKGYNKRIADFIQPMDFVLPGLGNSREMVNWAYKADKGDVSPVFSLEDKFVVAVLTSARKKGTAPLEDIRPQVEAEVKKTKKAEQIFAKVGTPATLEAAATATNQPVLTADGISFASPFIPSLGFEPRIAGAAFNKAWGTAKASAPIQGNSGVYVIKVNAYVPVPASGMDYTQQRAAYEQNVKQVVDQQLFQNVLKKKSDIKDNRAEFFISN